MIGVTGRKLPKGWKDRVEGWKVVWSQQFSGPT